MRSYYTENADEYESYYHTLELAVMFVENGRSQQEYRKTLEDMMDYSFEGMVLLNQEGRISFCNSMAREILEPESGDPTGKALWEMIPELDQKQIRTVVKDGETTVSYTHLADSAREWESPEPWRWSPSSSSATSLCPLWTCLFRPRC